MIHHTSRHIFTKKQDQQNEHALARIPKNAWPIISIAPLFTMFLFAIWGTATQQQTIANAISLMFFAGMVLAVIALGFAAISPESFWQQQSIQNEKKERRVIL